MVCPGTSSVASRVSSTFLRLKREGGISLELPQWKRAPSSVEGRISCFFSSCGRKHGVPLDLRFGPQRCARDASGKFILHACCAGPLRIPLQSVLGPRSSYGFEARTSGFLSSTDMDLGVPTEFPQWSHALSRVEICKSALLLSWKSSVRLPLELT